ncbi:Putative mannose-6-phosphate isomerase YvyI [Planococcus massiliensis]|uniref:Mannose-6-phosphate isomerase n=1 Tax=Planococcus massiliensis TaxID=1499687 RepID=A0A098EIL0_9BACL|nr:mannose-6-phosphate isomerase, class I [Planococcus massiliensis]CEG22118.1 Putative mannose-6-phosphate isomerase YvyI [Planococcus massiliensis]
MYKEPVFLDPVFQERIWGGSRLQTLFDYQIPTHLTGEAWVISAHENGPSVVRNGALKGKKLSDVWREHPNLFGRNASDDEFPLLVKILDANDNLSVQVHPDDQYAQKVVGKPCGKTECWYILDCDEDAEIIIGHKARSQMEFQEMVKNGEWQNLLQTMKVQKGDFIYVPSGTLHAIGKGIVILETQQSSDITYRVYDYDRTDRHGAKRELHLEHALTCTMYPHQDFLCEKLREKKGNLTSTRLVEETYFTVYHWLLKGKMEASLAAGFLMVSVIEGAGEFGSEDCKMTLKKGDNFIVPATIKDYCISGEMEMIVSHTSNAAIGLK